jgi:hypothetical protein
MAFFSNLWQTFLHFILWPLYFLQQENYNLKRFWSATPANLIPKKARQQLVWTKKLILILILSFLIASLDLLLIFSIFFKNDLENGLVDFFDFIKFYSLAWLMILPLSLASFLIFQSIFYSLSVLILSPIDNFFKSQITKKASKKVQKWRNNQL